MEAQYSNSQTIILIQKKKNLVQNYLKIKFPFHDPYFMRVIEINVIASGVWEIGKAISFRSDLGAIFYTTDKKQTIQMLSRWIKPNQTINLSKQSAVYV